MLKSAVIALYELAKADSSIVYLSADNGTEYDFLFAREFPDRYFNVGIAEGNMVGMAAGLAMTGKLPYMITAGPFLAYRSYEFIRNDICMQGLKAVFLGTGSGLSVGMLGPTHHTTEDLAVLGSLPGLEILCPSTAGEAGDAVRFARDSQHPVYVRLEMSGPARIEGAEPSPEPFPENSLLRIGRDALILSIGSVVGESLAAADALKKKGVDASVLAVRSFKPFRSDEATEAARQGVPIVAVEEHSVRGGLADAASLYLARMGVRAFVRGVGVPDGSFAVGYGTQSEMRARNGLDASSIAETVLKSLEGAAE